MGILTFCDGGKLKLEYQYLYQLHIQMLVTEKDFYDFVVWTERECTIEQIFPDEELHKVIVEKSLNYFLKVFFFLSCLISRDKGIII